MPRTLERDFQLEVKNYLDSIGVCYLRIPMTNIKRLGIRRGWPDFVFAYQGKPVAFECKGKFSTVKWRCPTPNQVSTQEAMIRDGWHYFIVEDLETVKILLERLKTTVAA